MENIENIIKNIKLWLNAIQRDYKNLIKIDILEDNKNMYRVIFELENCMAEIFINEPFFSPYKNVSFEAIDIIDGESKIIYFWYQKNENIEDIIKNLDKAINFIIKY